MSSTMVSILIVSHTCPIYERSSENSSFLDDFTPEYTGLLLSTKELFLIGEYSFAGELYILE